MVGGYNTISYLTEIALNLHGSTYALILKFSFLRYNERNEIGISMRVYDSKLNYILIYYCVLMNTSTRCMLCCSITVTATKYGTYFLKVEISGVHNSGLLQIRWLWKKLLTFFPWVLDECYATYSSLSVIYPRIQRVQWGGNGRQTYMQSVWGIRTQNLIEVRIVRTVVEVVNESSTQPN